MRIGHYDARLGAQGGITAYVRRVGRAQTRAGHDVLYLGRPLDSDTESQALRVRSDQELFSVAAAKALDVLHLHTPVDHLPDDRVPTLRTMHTNDGSCPSGSRYLKRSGRPCPRAYSIAGCLWGHFVDHCGSRRPHKTWANFRSIRREQAQATELLTLTVSRFLKEQMIRSGGPAEHLHVLHSPAPQVPIARAPLPRQAPPRFVFAGRIEPQKGVDWLLRAVAATGPSIYVDLAGTGHPDDLRALEQLARDLGIRAQVSFHGWLAEEEVYALIEEARGVVVPSVWHEPAGLVPLEAAALGRPVVASDVGGLPEYATDAFSLRVPPRDTEALAEALATLARHPDQAEAMGQRGHERARSTFAMDDFLDRLAAFYEQVRQSPALN